MKIYTRTGDTGQTSLFGGERVSKAHARVAAYGTLDELNSLLGLAAAHLPLNRVYEESKVWIEHVQKDVFVVGSWLASPKACENLEAGKEPFAGKAGEKTKTVDAERIEELETDIDGWEAQIEAMKSFILPGGAPSGATLHYARTVCRRAERECVALKEAGEVIPNLIIRYLNRLSDALFVHARYLNHLEHKTETKWI